MKPTPGDSADQGETDSGDSTDQGETDSSDGTDRGETDPGDGADQGETDPGDGADQGEGNSDKGNAAVGSGSSSGFVDPLLQRPAHTMRFNSEDPKSTGTPVLSNDTLEGVTPTDEAHTGHYHCESCGACYYDAYAVTVIDDSGETIDGYVVPDSADLSYLGGGSEWYIGGEARDLQALCHYIKEQAASAPGEKLTFTVYTGDIIEDQTFTLYDWNGDVLENNQIYAENLRRIDYVVTFNPTLTLEALAGTSHVFTMANFAQYFTNIGNAVQTAVLALTDGTSPVTVEVATAKIATSGDDLVVTLTFLSADELTANLQQAQEQLPEDAAYKEAAISDLTHVTSGFSITCERNDTPHEQGDTVKLGDTELSLDWGEQEEELVPGVAIKKEAGTYDAIKNQQTWTITLTPEEGGTLAGATLTDTLDEGAYFVSINISGITTAPLPIAPESLATGLVLLEGLTVDGQRLIYKFPVPQEGDDSAPDLEQPVTVTIVTQLTDAFFQQEPQDPENHRWILKNHASIEGPPGRKRSGRLER